MTKEINIHANKLLYPLQSLMGKFVHLMVALMRPIVPTKYRNKLNEIENNVTILNIIGLTFFNALGGIIVMFTNVKVANVLGAATYGLYAYYLAVGEVGSNFVRYGRHKTMTRDLIQNPHKFEGLVSNTFVLSIMNLVLYCTIIMILSKPLDVPFTLAAWLLIIGSSICCIDFQPVYESLKMISWHAIYHLIQKVIFFVGIWCGIWLFTKPSLLYLSVFFFCSWFVTLIIQYWEIIVRMSIRIKDYVSWSSIKELYKSNFLIALSCMTGVAFGPIIQMVLKDYSNSTAVGVYAAGMQIFILCQFLLNQIARVGNPMMAEAGKEDCPIEKRKLFVKRYTLIMILTSLPFLLPLTAFPHFVADIFYSAEYAELGDLLPWFGIYLFAFGLGVVYTQFLISMRQDKLYFTIYVISALATVGCAFLLIPLYGLQGAIISLCVPNSVGCLFYFICSLKYLR